MLRLIPQLLRYSQFGTVKAQSVYKQVALQGDSFYQQLTRRAFRVQKGEIFALYDLFERGLLQAHHDFINDCSLRLLSFQKQLNLGEIIAALRICVRFQVNNPPMIRHLESELYTRYFLQIGRELERAKSEKAQAKKEQFRKWE